eukprot:6500451-Heterocapsa_arctica.AAC.1
MATQLRDRSTARQYVQRLHDWAERSDVSAAMTRACEERDLELAWKLINSGLANTYADFRRNPRSTTS